MSVQGKYSRSRVPIARPDLGPMEQDNVDQAMGSGWITQGPFVAQAEDRLCEITGRKHAICTSSGTTALLVALMASDYDHEHTPRYVSAPAMTFAAVHNVIKLVGGIVGHVGADSDSWQVPYGSIANLRCDNTVIAAPCYGKLEGLDHAEKLVKRENYRLIEDACESFGGSLNGRAAGSFGLISVVSFYANKICTAGEGGALLTDDRALALRLRAIVNQGIVDKSYISAVPGLNGRMTDIQAAILCTQLDRLPKMLERRRHIQDIYESEARGRWRLRTTAPGEVCAPWLFAAIPEDSADVWKRCEAENIECRPFFPVLQPSARPEDPLMENASLLSRRGICLPLSSALTDDEVERVVKVIRD